MPVLPEVDPLRVKKGTPDQRILALGGTRKGRVSALLKASGGGK